MLHLWGNHAALNPLVDVSLDRVRGWLTYGGMDFSAVHFSCAAVALLDAKHHTVISGDLTLLLGHLSVRGINCTEDDAELLGLAVLQSMVEANALSIRPYSDWALDIPHEAFQPDQNTPKAFQSDVQQAIPPPSSEKPSSIVTASSALEFYCMGLLRQELDKRLGRLGKQQQVGTHDMIGSIPAPNASVMA